MSEKLHEEELVSTFLLVRHGQTRQVEAGKLYSDPTSALTELGVEEARAIAKWIAKERPEVLLSSPSVRVRATAQAIADANNLQMIVTEELHEWQVGEWEGRSYLEIKKAEPEVYAAWSKDPIRNSPPGGESIEQLCERTKATIAHFCKAYGGKRIVLATHAEVIRAFLVDALEMPVDNFWRISIPTASVCKVDFSANFATVHYTSFRPDLCQG